MIREILLLGNPELYKISRAVREEELPQIRELAADLYDTMMEFRRVYKAGRAIAAPQIGDQRRVLYMNVSDSAALSEGITFINPELIFPDGEKMEVMDDCMSFPGLLVKVNRYKRCLIRYRNLTWGVREMELSGDLSELLQHEYDHLDGILAVMRAADRKSFFYQNQRK